MPQALQPLWRIIELHGGWKMDFWDWAGRGIFLLYLAVLSVWDIRGRTVPLYLLIFGGLFDLGIVAASVIAEPQNAGRILIGAFLGLLPGLILVAIAIFSGKAGIADGVVLAELGIRESYLVAIAAWGIGSLLLAIVCGILLCIRRVKKTTRMPYIPFLAAGLVGTTLLQLGG